MGVMGMWRRRVYGGRGRVDGGGLTALSIVGQVAEEALELLDEAGDEARARRALVVGRAGAGSAAACVVIRGQCQPHLFQQHREGGKTGRRKKKKNKKKKRTKPAEKRALPQRGQPKKALRARRRAMVLLTAVLAPTAPAVIVIAVMIIPIPMVMIINVTSAAAKDGRGDPSRVRSGAHGRLGRAVARPRPRPAAVGPVLPVLPVMMAAAAAVGGAGARRAVGPRAARVRGARRDDGRGVVEEAHCGGWAVGGWRWWLAAVYAAAHTGSRLWEGRRGKRSEGLIAGLGLGECDAGELANKRWQDGCAALLPPVTN